jgi:hypothetical protein
MRPALLLTHQIVGFIGQHLSLPLAMGQGRSESRARAASSLTSSKSLPISRLTL